ncbi:hypothetical protein GCM10023307_26760 [Lysobacter hankyongensis]|uniref:DUF4892 domain-containing protein n=2 Tax=Lysobacter hankyongensis TaxID=1176535 RepID=A0ABP9BQV0_9GAMM
MALALIVAGCGRSVNGVDQAGKTQLAPDLYGCPDLSGTYAFPPPGAKGVSYRGSMLEEFPIEWGNRVPASQIRGLTIRRVEPGAYEFRFMVEDTRVVQHLALIREFYKPRYRELYHLLQAPQRDAFIAREGEAAHAKRVAELGPPAEIVRTLRAGTDMICRDGWIELPRAYTKPIRLTLGEDRSILGESREISTVGITVWCGDGCKDLPIPTGTYTGTLRWPRDDAQRPWRVQDLAARSLLERPIDEIEAEVARREAEQARSDADRFLAADDIRGRLEGLAPAGTVVETVEVRGGEVHVRYTAPTADVDTLLNRVAGVGGNGAATGPQRVQRIVTSGRFHVRSVEFVLTDSPMVLRSEATASMGNASGEDPASGMAVLSAAPSAAVAGSAPANAPGPATTANAAGSQLPPAGYADPLAIQRRVGRLFPAGCRVVDVRYGGERVTLTGQAETHRCVSDGMRALDAAQSRPELLSIVRESNDSHRFEILIVPSALTAK